MNPTQYMRLVIPPTEKALTPARARMFLRGDGIQRAAFLQIWRGVSCLSWSLKGSLSALERDCRELLRQGEA